MTNRLEPATLEELRAKTDYQLLDLLAKQLDAAMHSALMGEDPAAIQKVCEEADRLLTVVPPDRREKVSRKLALVRRVVTPARWQVAC
jgi:hypothetical protein